ncbi:thiamine biosynthesis protein ThiF [Rhizobium rhizosphaerae]|uniref:Thiamine biosynthesis protein ThiF n=1 Tax=Xaviernesmea rhizosphaerae TaxID=1672749 RepID=A0ABX3P9F9_9HYPH|nr:molybdopterin-synthase adenylyltransferase MoeB [Xaviernesmea rhizosphaerae]OQP84637.1 thiamine biosynthesis protein ThiF [Xaviernesmea rhizosphaerae]
MTSPIASAADDRRLGSEEIERYRRHLLLAEIGGAGQQRLKAARVLVIGAGGLGAPVLLYLAAAGIGTLGVADDDRVSLSNLQRQVIHATPDLDRPKVESAAERVGAINPHVAFIAHAERLTADNAERLIGAYDLVIDGSDNFTTRYLVADVAERLEKPLVTGAVGRFDGSLTVLTPYATAADGTRMPRYRDLFPEPPPEGVVPACAEAGVMGALTGVIGTLQAMEAIKLLTGAGEPLIGRLLMYDGLAARFETIRYRRRRSAP